MAVTALLIRIFIVYVLKYVIIFYSLVLVPFQIVNRNYIYTIVYMPEGVHIWHSNWLLSVDHRCDLGIEAQSQIYLQSI